jgi:hypothetical protein
VLANISPAFDQDDLDLVNMDLIERGFVQGRCCGCVYQPCARRYAQIELAKLRKYRESAEGLARRKRLPLLALCDPIKNDNFHAVNPLGRPSHSL